MENGLCPFTVYISEHGDRYYQINRQTNAQGPLWSKNKEYLCLAIQNVSGTTKFLVVNDQKTLSLLDQSDVRFGRLVHLKRSDANGYEELMTESAGLDALFDSENRSEKKEKVKKLSRE